MSVGRVERAILEHHLCHAAELVLPWSDADAATALAAASTAGGAYWRVRCTLDKLLTPEFVDSHVRGGQLRALAATALDSGPTVAIVPPGKLLITCDRALYSRLGLDGLPSSFVPGRAAWCICVDLLSPAFASAEHPGHARMVQCLVRLGATQLLLHWQELSLIHI